MPILFSRKELQRGTGGNGASRGGDGQIISFSMRTRDEWLLNAVTSRTTLAPEGLEGGEPGVAGRFLINGEPVSNARKIVMQPSDEVLLTTPGGAVAMARGSVATRCRVIAKAGKNALKSSE